MSSGPRRVSLTPAIAVIAAITKKSEIHYVRADIADALQKALKDSISSMELSGWDLVSDFRRDVWKAARVTLAKAEGREA